MIEHFNKQSFNWLTWINGSIVSILNIPHRTQLFLDNRHIIRKYAIGWCKSDNIPCRPKTGQIAVMFDTGDLDNWWTHLRKIEFETIFPEIKLL